MFNFCKHKFNRIENGYQYCDKCGKAIPVICNHKWIVYREIQKYDSISKY